MPGTYYTLSSMHTSWIYTYPSTTGFPIDFLLLFRALDAQPPELKVASLFLDWLCTKLAAPILFKSP